MKSIFPWSTEIMTNTKLYSPMTLEFIPKNQIWKLEYVLSHPESQSNNCKLALSLLSFICAWYYVQPTS